MNLIFTSIIATSALGAEPASEAPEVMVLLNARNPTASVSTGQLKQIYLGQTAFWHGVVPMKVVMRPPTSDSGKTFLGDVLGISSQKYERTWAAKQLSGNAVTPPVAPSAQNVVDLVAQQPGAIGFMLASEAWSLPDTVKVVPIQ